MRSTLRLLAEPLTHAANPIRSNVPLAILPPLHLYRRLLRTHRKHLDPEKRLFGDEYVKAEFRRHRDIDNPIHIIGFLSQWQLYAQQLEGNDWQGKKLDQEVLDKLSDQQVGQLYELMTAIQKRARGEEVPDEAFEGEAIDLEGKKK